MDYVYRVKDYGIDIIRLECHKRTEKCVWVDNWGSGNIKRSLKDSVWAKFFDTWEEAWDYIMSRCDEKIRRAQSAMDAAKAEKQKINNMPRPVD